MARMRERTENDARVAVEREFGRSWQEGGASLLLGWQEFPKVWEELCKTTRLVMKRYPVGKIDFEDDRNVSQAIANISTALKNDLASSVLAARKRSAPDTKHQSSVPPNPDESRRGRRDQQKSPRPGAGRREVAASKTASEYLAWHMNDDDQIKDFRRRVLGYEEGTDYDQGISFITSSLAKVLSVEDFGRLRLLPITTTGSVMLWAERWADSVNQPVNSLVEMLFPAGKRSPVRRDALPEMIEFIVGVDVPFPKSDGEMAIIVKSLPTASYACISYPRSTSFFGFPEDDDIFHLAPPYLSPAVRLPFDPDKGYMEGLEGSVALEALGLCQHIMEACPVAAWDALIFLMTGKFSIPSLDGHFFDYRSPAQANGSQQVPPASWRWGRTSSMCSRGSARRACPTSGGTSGQKKQRAPCRRRKTWPCSGSCWNKQSPATSSGGDR